MPSLQSNTIALPSRDAGNVSTDISLFRNDPLKPHRGSPISYNARLEISKERSASCLQVERMAKQFKVAEDVAYTCETAAHFWLLHVLSRWERFLAQLKGKEGSAGSVKVGRLPWSKGFHCI